ncbi:CopM family metallochaperone [Neisseria sp. P0020.S005]|uniref:CopM family metallochaperone n=1 Tax=Neisseria sp. P0020.S005 TaxID=3436810 RepID=UPI003F7F8D93
MKKLMTFITLSAVAISNYAQANEQPHQAHMNMPMSTGSAMQQELMQGMNQMNQDMMAAAQYKDPDVAFAAGMLPHHIGAVKMAEVELKYGKNPEMRKLAEDIINAQQAEIEQMQKWLKVHNKKSSVK